MLRAARAKAHQAYTRCLRAVFGNCYSIKELVPEILIVLAALAILYTLLTGV